MSLIDSDRFEGKYKGGGQAVEVSDLMRRMVKEKLLKFDGTPLFPPRKAKTVPFQLSEKENNLYTAVTSYVRQEFNRAEALQNNKQAGTIGFALTVLQRRLASSPEAIYQSLIRRKERLKKRLQELESGQTFQQFESQLEIDDLIEMDEFTDTEEIEPEILDQATAARTKDELISEINILDKLIELANDVLKSKEDRKWQELAEVLHTIFLSQNPQSEYSTFKNDQTESNLPTNSSENQKFVIFTEHRDTLTYLTERVSTLLGDSNSVVNIHGNINRNNRLFIQEEFKNNPSVKVLIATDAAGEGINLQCAHLMVNYDLPWNPNRLEQRFGRIHRIGQEETCYLWNLVATETREGDVYSSLLEKLERARESLSGQVFDVLGKLVFDGKTASRALD